MLGFQLYTAALFCGIFWHGNMLGWDVSQNQINCTWYRKRFYQNQFRHKEHCLLSISAKHRHQRNVLPEEPTEKFNICERRRAEMCVWIQLTEVTGKAEIRLKHSTHFKSTHMCISKEFPLKQFALWSSSHIARFPIVYWKCGEIFLHILLHTFIWNGAWNECFLQIRCLPVFFLFCFIDWYTHSIQPKSIEIQIPKYLHIQNKGRWVCFSRIECVCETMQRCTTLIEIGNWISRMEMQVERFFKAIEIHSTWTDFMEYTLYTQFDAVYMWHSIRPRSKLFNW